MFIKFIIIALVLINLKPPFVLFSDILLMCFLIFMLISSRSILFLKQINFQKYMIVLILILLTITNLMLPKLKIEEAHSIFINDKDIKIVESFLPTKIISAIKHEFKNFDVNRMIKGHDSLNSIEDYNRMHTINTPYAYSSDSFFQNNNLSRQVNKISFSSREELRIGDLNTLNYALVYDKNFRRILPFYVLYEIPKIAKNSKICIYGHAYYYFSQDNLKVNEIKLGNNWYSETN